MKQYELDYGSWEKGIVIKVQAKTISEALSNGVKIAKQKSYTGNAVQMFEIKGDKKRLVWDFMSGAF